MKREEVKNPETYTHLMAQEAYRWLLTTLYPKEDNRVADRLAIVHETEYKHREKDFVSTIYVEEDYVFICRDNYTEGKITSTDSYNFNPQTLKIKAL